ADVPRWRLLRQEASLLVPGLLNGYRLEAYHKSQHRTIGEQLEKDAKINEWKEQLSHPPLIIRFTCDFSFRWAGLRPLANSRASPRVKCGSGKGKRAIASLTLPIRV